MNEIEIKKNREVHLNLRDKTRCIGTLKGKVYEKRINSKNHLFRKSRCIGFCYELLKNHDFDYIKVITGTQILRTGREYVLAKGTFLDYSAQGFEKQIFLKIDDFGLEKLWKWEREHKEKNENISLF